MAPRKMTTQGVKPFEGETRDAYDLDQYRQRFEQLYIQEDRVLNDVIEILKGEGCQASRSKYLKKIRLWGLEKHNKHEDMLQLLQRINQTQQFNENQVFQIRGRDITAGEVVRYFRRRPVVTPRKPVAPKTKRWVNLTVPQSEHISPSLTLPETLEITQKFFQAISNAQSQVLKMALLEKSRQKDPKLMEEIRKRLPTLSEDINQGVWLIWNGQSRIGGARLERGFQAFENVIQHGYPDIISRFFNWVQLMHYYKLPELVEMFTRYLHQISYTIFGPTHPMASFTYYFSRHWNQLEVLRQGAIVHLDTTSDIVGKSDLTTLKSRYTVLLILKTLNTPLEEISPKYESLISDSQSIERRLHIASKKEYANYLATHGEYSQGMAMLYELMAEIHKPLTDWKAASVTLGSSADYASLLMDQPNLEGFVEDEAAKRKRYLQAEAILKIAVEKSTLKLGTDHTFTLDIIGKLERFYTKYGGSPDDAKVQLDHLMGALRDFQLRPGGPTLS